jgi:AraC family transcriptional regulator
MRAIISTKANVRHTTTSRALEDYLPFQLVHSSAFYNWPSVLIKHYRTNESIGYLPIPNTPDNLIILNLSQAGKGLKDKQYGRRPIQSVSDRGSISFVPAGQSWLTNCKGSTEYVHVHILSQEWNRLLTDILQEDSTRVVLQNLSDIEDLFLEDILYKLYKELTCAGKGSNRYVESLGQALVVHIIRHYISYREKPVSVCEKLPGFKFNHVLAYIKQNLSREITLLQLSSLIGLSPFHFSRVFKATTGLAPYRYITKLRMEHSQRLLLETELPIIYVGLEVGISNPSHFSSFFKQYSGLTPTMYRKRQTEMHS